MRQELYIIHGWAYTVEPWQQTIDLLNDRGIDITMLHVPGLTEPSDKVWTIDDYAEWLDGALQGIENPVVLGHSNGGRIALHYLANQPDRFKHLILLAAAGIELGSERLSIKRKVFRIAAKVLAPLKHVPYFKKIVYRLLGSDYDNAPENMKKTLANMLASDKAFNPSTVTTPTSLIYGSDDTVTPPALGKKLASLLPNSKLSIKKGWRHAPYRTHPDELANSIASIMEELR